MSTAGALSPPPAFPELRSVSELCRQRSFPAGDWYNLVIAAGRYRWGKHPNRPRQTPPPGWVLPHGQFNWIAALSMIDR